MPKVPPYPQPAPFDTAPLRVGLLRMLVLIQPGREVLDGHEVRHGAK